MVQSHFYWKRPGLLLILKVVQLDSSGNNVHGGGHLESQVFNLTILILIWIWQFWSDFDNFNGWKLIEMARPVQRSNVPPSKPSSHLSFTKSNFRLFFTTTKKFGWHFSWYSFLKGIHNLWLSLRRSEWVQWPQRSGGTPGGKEDLTWNENSYLEQEFSPGRGTLHRWQPRLQQSVPDLAEEPVAKLESVSTPGKSFEISQQWEVRKWPVQPGQSHREQVEEVPCWQLQVSGLTRSTL